MLIATTITTSETIVLGVFLFIWFIWIGYLQITHDNEVEALDEYHKSNIKRLDNYLEALNNAINTVRTGENTESKSTNS